MNRNGRKNWIAAVAVGAFGISCSAVHATRFTEAAEFWVGNQTLNIAPPTALIELNGLSAQGGLYTNTFEVIDANTVGIRTIGANRISGGSLQGNFSIGLSSPVNLGSQLADDLMVIYALTGTASLSGGGAGAVFLSGRAIVISFDPGTNLFNDQDPTTWQFDVNGANVLAVYDLGAREDVTKGPNGDLIGDPSNSTIPAQNTNFSNINLQTEDLGQGILLFDFVGNGDALPEGANGPFQKNVGPLAGLPGTEGLIVFAETTNLSNDPLSQAQENALNLIMSTLVTGEVFSSNDNAISTYNPLMQGDFFNENSINANPTSSAIVPEPASAALGLMALAGLAFRGRRNRIS